MPGGGAALSFNVYVQARLRLVGGVYKTALRVIIIKSFYNKSRMNCTIHPAFLSSGEFPYPRRRSTPLHLYCPQTEGMAVAAHNNHSLFI